MTTLETTALPTPEELFEIYSLDPVHGRKPSIDAYVAVRPYATHTQAIEIAQAGNILPSSYIMCLENGNATHDEVIEAATVHVPGPAWYDSIFRGQSAFDLMVEEYIGRRVGLAEGIIGRKLGITNQGAYSLNAMLQYANIESIAAAWQQITPRQSSMTFRKLVANGEDPEQALALLYK